MKLFFTLSYALLALAVLVTGSTNPRSMNRMKAAQFHRTLTSAVQQGQHATVNSLVAPRLAYITCIGERRNRIEFKQRSDFLRDIMSWGTGRIVSVEPPFRGIVFFEVNINGRVFQYAVSKSNMQLHSVRERGC